METFLDQNHLPGDCCVAARATGTGRTSSLEGCPQYPSLHWREGRGDASRGWCARPSLFSLSPCNSLLRYAGTLTYTGLSLPLSTRWALHQRRKTRGGGRVKLAAPLRLRWKFVVARRRYAGVREKLAGK